MSYRAPNLPPAKHCFFGSAGGYSEGFYRGLNVNTKSDDDAARVAANLQKAAACFGLDGSRLHLLNQGVSAVTEYVEEPTQDKMTADGAVTDRPNVVLCIRTADCAPVLLADYEHGVVGAAHAGWRGAVAGIQQRTVGAMERLGADAGRIRVFMGPCICQDCFEVGEEVACRFGDRFVSRRPGERPHVDLAAYVADTLVGEGVRADHISLPTACTRCRPDRYFSARASGIASGRNFTFIYLR